MNSAAAGAAAVVGSSIPCMDKLREELSCAVRYFSSEHELVFFMRFLIHPIADYWVPFSQICLEICFEPSTTPCGHR